MSGMSRVENYESSRTVFRPTLPLNQMVMCDALNLPTQLDQFGTGLIHIDEVFGVSSNSILTDVSLGLGLVA